MPKPDYYREQARLLMRWAAAALDGDVARRLTHRAHELMQLADRGEIDRELLHPTEMHPGSRRGSGEHTS
jgi:hypothetical protein